MQLTPEQVRHIAKLARLDLKDDEVSRYSSQLTNILTYIEILNEVKTDGVAPTSQVTGLQNVTRPDVACEWVIRDELLGCTTLPVEQNQIRVKPVISS
jgi:aspartyl-tRNA(Asn)/glutamyl-tRNA(Gln) amidotransferase subunit C